MGRLFYLFFVKFLLAAFLCASTGCTLHNVTPPEELPSLIVRENVFYSENRPYAELRYLHTAKLEESPGEAYLFVRPIQHRGLAMYYYDDGALVWIYPKEKEWQEDVDRCCRSHKQGHYGWVFDVTIS